MNKRETRATKYNLEKSIPKEFSPAAFQCLYEEVPLLTPIRNPIIAIPFNPIYSHRHVINQNIQNNRGNHPHTHTILLRHDKIQPPRGTHRGRRRHLETKHGLSEKTPSRSVSANETPLRSILQPQKLLSQTNNLFRTHRICRIVRRIPDNIIHSRAIR